MKSARRIKCLCTATLFATSQFVFSNEYTTMEMVKESKIKYLISTVNKSDGISEHEAKNLVEAYFLKNVGCGAYGKISESTDFWLIEVFEGVAGERVDGALTISKSTGEISSPIGPSYENPEEILQK